MDAQKLHKILEQNAQQMQLMQQMMQALLNETDPSRRPGQSRTRNGRGRVVLASSAEANVNAVRYYVTAKVNEHQIESQLDTGSGITSLNVDEWKRLGSPKLKDTSLVVKDACGNQMKVHGELMRQARLKSAVGEGKCYVPLTKA
ncbi:hypothetical protein Aduo_014810 [Ancylostoma duodenale]